MSFTASSRALWPLLLGVALAVCLFGCTIELPPVDKGAYRDQTTSGDASYDLASCAGKADGTVCTDNDPRTTNDACAASVCVGAKFADFFVTTLEDADAGSCTAAKCTLRDAMTAALASAQTEAPVIAFFVEGTIVLKATLPAVTRSVVIDAGAGVAAAVAKLRIGIDGAKAHRAFRHLAGKLTLRNLRVFDGAADKGGAVQCDIGTTGALVIEDCVFERNIAVMAGGAVHCVSATVIRRTTFIENAVTDASANALGGAVAVVGITEIHDSTFLRNKSGQYGGAVAGLTSSILTIKGSAFVDNQAIRGGAIASFSHTKLFNVTMAGNGGPLCVGGGGLLAVGSWRGAPWPS